MSIPGHLCIPASAGSGKTFQLAHRYIALMARGVHPDRVCALTFSRKAAGEIFDSVVGYLVAAAASDEDALETAQRIGLPGADRATFVSLLRRFVGNLHRSHIGTLDSFMIGVVRAFPTELGIAADFQVLESDGPAASELRRDTLCRVFDPGRAGRKAQEEFLEAFRLATFGREEKALSANLARFIAENRSVYQVLPVPGAWGDAAVIWPDGCPWPAPAADADDPVRALRAALAASHLEGKLAERWATFLDAVLSFGTGSAWTRDIGFVFEKLTAVLADLRAGRAAIRMDRKEHSLTPEQCRCALAVVEHVVGIELKACMRRTAGVFEVLHQYELLYDALIRKLGRLSFSDAQYLLTRANDWSGGALMSRLADEAGRLYIDYRLDCKLDHWLLDEFQDTSDLQWSVLENLADEILQDDSGQRSFFYVGDVKQAIYGWRGGNARLFGKILEDYGGRIRVQSMDVSYRSCKTVIDAVNRVFGDLSATGLPAGAVEQWQTVWKPHASAPRLADAAGHVAVLEPLAEDGRKPGEEDRFEVVARLLRRLDPLRHGLSAAVLVRRNATGHAIVDALRNRCPGLPVIHEGNATIVDNPVVSLLLSLVRFAAHPGDTFCWRHIQMSPLWRPLQSMRLGRDTLPPQLLREIEDGGFQAMVLKWGAILGQDGALDAFGRMRLEDLATAAAEFDSGGTREVGAFVRFVDAYQVKESSSGGGVRVMTVHQAKGLGFDVVILPDLMGGGMASGHGPDLMVHRDRSTELPRWVLRQPRRCIAEADPVLAEELRVRDEQAAFDALCVLYVAMTRARRALYMVTSFPGKTARALNEAALVKLQLAGDAKPTDCRRTPIDGEPTAVVYEAGSVTWTEQVRGGGVTEEEAETPMLPPAFASRRSQRRRLVAVEPSAQEEIVSKASRLFNAERRDVLDFGSAIHALFEKIEWLDDFDPDEAIRSWRERTTVSSDVERDACSQFRNALLAPDVQRALSRPEGHVELWREKRFEIVLDEKWVSGAFDRVLIHRDADGRALRAVITDYKSDRVNDDAACERVAREYAPQLELYGKALARILGLDEVVVARRVLFTRRGRLITL